MSVGPVTWGPFTAGSFESFGPNKFGSCALPKDTSKVTGASSSYAPTCSTYPFREGGELPESKRRRFANRPKPGYRRDPLSITPALARVRASSALLSVCQRWRVPYLDVRS